MLLNLLEIIVLFPAYNDRCYNPLGGCTEDERQRRNSTGIYWTEGNKQVQVLSLFCDHLGSAVTHYVYCVKSVPPMYV